MNQKVCWGGTVHIPYNNDILLIEKVKELNLPNDVCFYFAPSPLLSGTGRRLPAYDKYFSDKKFLNDKFDEDLLNFLKKCKEYGFRTNLLLNNILLGLPYTNEDLQDTIPKIQKYLEKLDEDNLISLVTVGNPYIIELLNFDKLKNIKIKTSVNMQIKTEKSIELLNVILENFVSGKLSEVEIQKDLLRNIPLLKKIRQNLDSDIKLSILVNEGCIRDCPYQQIHQVHASNFPLEKLSHFDDEFKFTIAKCKNITSIDRWRFLDSNWILPTQLHYYKDVVDSIKLTGRGESTESIIYKIKAYVFCDYDKSNLNKLISLMKNEEWVFPENTLPEDFDDILFQEKPNSYYIKIFDKIDARNVDRVNIKIKGIANKKLYDYEGV